jgi:hypothetical protein
MKVCEFPEGCTLNVSNRVRANIDAVAVELSPDGNAVNIVTRTTSNKNIGAGWIPLPADHRWLRSFAATIVAMADEIEPETAPAVIYRSVHLHERNPEDYPGEAPFNVWVRLDYEEFSREPFGDDDELDRGFTDRDEAEAYAQSLVDRLIAEHGEENVSDEVEVY